MFISVLHRSSWSYHDHHTYSYLPRHMYWRDICRKHYSDVIMSAIASQINGVTIVYWNVCSGADQRKHQSSASLAQRFSNAENVESSDGHELFNGNIPFTGLSVRLISTLLSKDYGRCIAGDIFKCIFVEQIVFWFQFVPMTLICNWSLQVKANT